MERLLLIVIPLAAAVVMPSLYKKPGPIYWGALAVLVGLALVAAAVSHKPGMGLVNSEVSFTVFLFVVPMALCFVLCRLPFLRNRPILVAICAPLCLVFGVLAGLSLGVCISFLEP